LAYLEARATVRRAHLTNSVGRSEAGKSGGLAGLEANWGRTENRRAGKLVGEAAGDGGVGVDAAVAEEGPVLAGGFDEGGVEGGGEDLFLVVPGLGEDAAEGVGDEAAAPELEAGGGGVVAGAGEGDCVGRAF